MNSAVIFDLDWTLCELWESTTPYNHSWEEILNDNMLEEIIDEWLPLHVDIIILTWRKHSDHHQTTVEWLEKNKVPYDYLIMCKDWKPEENHIFKKRALRVLSQMYDIRMVYDDNHLVGEVCKKLKIPFYPVY